MKRSVFYGYTGVDYVVLVHEYRFFFVCHTSKSDFARPAYDNVRDGHEEDAAVHPAALADQPELRAPSLICCRLPCEGQHIDDGARNSGDWRRAGRCPEAQKAPRKTQFLSSNHSSKSKNNTGGAYFYGMFGTVGCPECTYAVSCIKAL